MKEIYFDNSATTRVSDGAAKEALRIMTEVYGNPSSLHRKGLEAEHELKAARDTVAASLGAESGEIYFTSGGTEANNTAVLGAAAALRRRGKRIVTTAIEHSSVLEAMKRLEGEGFEVVYLKPDVSGRVSAEDIAKAVTKDTILVSIMLVNNETGAIQPVEAVRRAIKLSGAPALFHIDAVQGYMKMPVSVKKLGADLMSISAHKINGPKGVGALYVRKGARIIPLHLGGEQQSRIRPGTEPLPLICAMAQAVREHTPAGAGAEGVRDVSSYLRERLSSVPGVVINSDEDCSPYMINFSAVGLRSETILHYLEEDGIYVSSGSACAKGHKSHVLTAMGLPPERIDSAVRVSFCDSNTREEADIFVNKLETGLSVLARSR